MHSLTRCSIRPVLKEAILKTLCYRDLFDYPLTEEELGEFLIEKAAGRSEVAHALAQLVAEDKVKEERGFYFLRGREEVVEIRLKREKISGKKFLRVRRFLKVLRFLPWVEAVFLTGALAAGNAQRDDDIDLMVVTRRNRVWLTRFLATLLFDILRIRRKPRQESQRDQFCLNIFLAENALALPESEQNLYSSHEVALAYPLWSRGYINERFLSENPWVTRFLPNLELPEVRTKAAKFSGILGKAAAAFWSCLDFALWRLQLSYMGGKRTREIVERNRIFFHPVDLAKKILPAYKVRVYRALHSNFARLP